MATTAIDHLEEAAHLLRRAPLKDWLWHWAGSVPFALALLLFWSDVRNPRTPDTRVALESLLLTAMLVWLNVCRAQFSQSLRARLGQISRSARDVRTPEFLLRALPAQAFLCATKLIALPVSLLTVFSLPQTIAFYRYSAVLTVNDADSRRAIAKAARLASLPGLHWSILAILVLLQMALALNLAIVIGAAPQIVRILTGHESAFSRSGVYFVQNPLFFVLVLVSTWLAFDPYVQTVYTLRCFHLESLETGEDLRAGLHRIGAPALLSAAIAVPPEDLRRSIDQTMRAHSYDWRLPPPSTAAQHGWLANLTDHAIALLRSIGHAIGNLLDRLFRWLRESIGPGDLRPGAPPSRGLHWSIYVLIGAALVLAAVFVWRMRSAARRPRPVAPVLTGPTPVELDADDLAPDRLPEEQWLELAGQCLGRGDLRLALRAFFLANLAWLGRREFVSIHPGKTNREYERELRRRARALAGPPELFSANITAFERAWYGMHEVTAGDIQRFRDRIDQMKAASA